MSPTPSFSAPQVVPGALEPRATILGTRQEPVAGYAVGGFAFVLWRDVAGVPTAINVTLTAGNKTLVEVITEINATVGITPDVMASEDNGYLRLTSPTVGGASYLRLQSVAGSEDFFYQMGLFSETVARGGDPRQAQHIDPYRETAQPGQMALAVGEAFTSNAVNRSLHALGQNIDRAYGLLDLKTVGVKTRETFAGSGATNVRLNTSSPTEPVFVGISATPSTEALEDTIVVLDTNGDEFTQEYVETLDGGLSDLAFTADPNTGETICSSATANFVSTDVYENVYVLVTNFSTTSLNNVPLKVIRYIDANTVAVQSIVPSTGLRLTTVESGRSGSRIRIHNLKAAVDGLYSDAGLTTRVEGVNVARTTATGVVDRVERNNRIVVQDPSVDFTVDCVAGDIVTWSGASSSDPWSNNGLYRVGNVVDAQTLELASSDFGPVYLNPNAGGGFGTIAVTSDGAFTPQPYARFAQPTAPNIAAGIGAVPQTGDTFQMVYMVGRSLRAALEANPVALTSSPRFDQDATADVKRALMRLGGPSLTDFNEVLHGNYVQSIESLDYRMDREHYESGRHWFIRPDYIDMFPGVTGRTVAVRAAGGDAGTVAKFELLSSGGASLLRMLADGSLVVGQGARYAGTAVFEVSTSGYQERAFRAAGTNYETVSTDFVNTLTNPEQGTLPSAQKIWEWDDGVVSDPVQFAWALMYGTATPYSAGSPYVGLKLNVNNDGAGNRLDNVWVIEPSGAMGFNMGANGALSRPAVPYHFRARTTSDLELLRLEGASDLQQTVALSFKPLLNSNIFGFMEMDVDAATWFMNFALTSDAAAASAGAEAFRFITGATGVGLGTEIMRASTPANPGALATAWAPVVEAGRSLGGSADEAFPARFGSSLVASYRQNAMRFAGAGLNLPGLSVYYPNSSGAAWLDLMVGARTDVNGTYHYDVAGGATNLVNPLRLRFNPYGVSAFMSLQRLPESLIAPIADGSWYEGIRFGIVQGNQGYINLFSASGPSSVSFTDSANPAATYPVAMNSLIAKKVLKAWLHCTMLASASGNPTVNDGVGFHNVTPVVNGVSNAYLEFTLRAPMANLFYGAKAMIVGPTNALRVVFNLVPVSTTVFRLYLYDVVGATSLDLSTLVANTDLFVEVQGAA